MQLILLQKVTNLGGLGDKVNVKPGYGRNFLIPYGKAVPATACRGCSLTPSMPSRARAWAVFIRVSEARGLAPSATPGAPRVACTSATM